MKLKKILLCSLMGLSYGMVQAANITVDSEAQLDQNENQLEQEAQIQFFQKIVLSAMMHFFDIDTNVTMVCAILREDFRDPQKVERLISKHVEQYVNLYLPELLKKELGVTNPQELQQINQAIAPFIHNLLSGEIEKYLMIERKMYPRYTGAIRVPKR